MRRILNVIGFVVMLFSMVSCERSSSLETSEEMVRVTFDVSQATKSTSEASMDRIRRMDVFVFLSETGEIISYDSIEEGSISLYLQRGIQHDCCFIVNAPAGSFNGIRNYSDLKAKTSSFSDNLDRFVMQGEVSRIFLADGNLEVEVSRLCSKIVVDNLVPKFMDSAISQSSVIFRRVFLMNTSPVLTYFGDYTDPDFLYNSTGYDEDLNLYIRNHLSCEYHTPLFDSSAKKIDSALYCYSADAEGADLSVTKLVFELEIAGKPNYYTVLFPVLKPNHEYHIESVKLLGFGSPIPGEVFDRTEITFVVSVNPWEESAHKDTVME